MHGVASRLTPGPLCWGWTFSGQESLWGGGEVGGRRLPEGSWCGRRLKQSDITCVYSAAVMAAGDPRPLGTSPYPGWPSRVPHYLI